MHEKYPAQLLDQSRNLHEAAAGAVALGRTVELSNGAPDTPVPPPGSAEASNAKLDAMFAPIAEDPRSSSVQLRQRVLHEPATERETKQYRVLVETDEQVAERQRLESAQSEARSAKLYDRLFSEEPQSIEPEQPERFTLEDLDAPPRPVKQWEATEGTKAAARAQLDAAMRADAGLKAVLVELGTRRGLTQDKSLAFTTGMVDLLRTDAEVRLTAGRYLAGKLEHWIDSHILETPDRVLRNIGKTGRKGTKTHQDQTSREYVTLIALAKLDGTFHQADSDSDRVILNGRTAEYGQHRFTADELLKWHTMRDGWFEGDHNRPQRQRSGSAS